MKDKLDNQTKHRPRYIPLVRNLKIRTIIGFTLLLSSVILAKTIFDKGRIEIIILVFVLAWIIAVFLTDKYVHKYPQRYFSYLIASHLKAAIIMAIFLWIISRIIGYSAMPRDVLWAGFMFFVLADALVSIPEQRDILKNQPLIDLTFGRKDSTDSADTNLILNSIDTPSALNQIRSDLDKPLIEFIEKKLPNTSGEVNGALVVDDVVTTGNQFESPPVGLLVGRTNLNNVRRLNQFLQFCTNRITMGGYFVARYIPLENVNKNLRRRYKGLLYWLVYISHFIWYDVIPKIPWFDKLYFSPMFSWLDTLYLSITKKRNRILSKAETWGRLAFYGMRVIAESEGDNEVYLIAQRVALPAQNKTQSYYPIVALEKVGLDGKRIYAHKIRTMHPFSEFLQKRMFEDYGLLSTGKFANDFRVSEIGKFLRKYWLDELPQIFDWLRGDIKLVGLRATSPHFLSLYPKEFYDLYIQIKPGLIPPIFSESIKSFEQIIEIEFTYLKSYWGHPIRTDIRYFIRTFKDIVFKGTRSK